jgi:hypothetical protein
LPNTVYPAYAPASSLMLQANATGGTGSYTYNWSTSATTSSITVSPTLSTLYSVTVRDQNGCPGMASKTINVMDVSSGKKGDKINVCHKGKNTLSIGMDGVSDHLAHGDMLGSCSAGSITAKQIMGANGERLIVKALSNPSANFFDLQLSGKTGNNVQLNVYDFMGRVIESRGSINANQRLRIGGNYLPGVYLVQVVQGEVVETIRLVKTK